MSTTRSRRTLAGAGAAAIAVAGAAALLGPGTGSASSHREAPLLLNDPLVDNTDVYAFVSPDKADTVTLLANWIPFEEPGGGPNFYPFANGAHYDINIDNNGDAKPDITYRWTFASRYKNADTFLYTTGPVNSIDDKTLNFKQTYKLEVLDGSGKPTTLVDNAKVAPSDVGDASMPNYAALRDQAITPLPNGLATFAGQADATRRSRRCPTAWPPSPARPTTRSSSICGCSTCCTAPTSRRSAPTRSTASTSTRSASRCRSRCSAKAATAATSSASGARPSGRP